MLLTLVSQFARLMNISYSALQVLLCCLYIHACSPILFFLPAVHTHVLPPIPGALQNISKNDTGVQKAVLAGTYSFNNKSNDAFLFKASAVDDAKRQVLYATGCVRYVQYMFTLLQSTRLCPAIDSERDPLRSDCRDLSNHVQKDGKEQ